MSQIEIRQTKEFAKWFQALRDLRAADRIAVRIRRLSLGQFGDIKSLGGNLFEVRIDHGPGYRLYFTRRDHIVCIFFAVVTRRASPVI